MYLSETPFIKGLLKNVLFLYKTLRYCPKSRGSTFRIIFYPQVTVTIYNSRADVDRKIVLSYIYLPK